MALLEGALRVNLLLNSRQLYKCTSCVSVRSLSEHVTAKAVKGSAPETAGDHLIYTPEHFALKASLRKVCSTVSISRTMKRKMLTLFRDTYFAKTPISVRLNAAVLWLVGIL